AGMALRISKAGQLLLGGPPPPPPPPGTPLGGPGGPTVRGPGGTPAGGPCRGVPAAASLIACCRLPNPFMAATRFGGSCAMISRAACDWNGWVVPALEPCGGGNSV